MALKSLMLRKKIEDKKKELEAVKAAGDFETREAELEKSIEEAETDEEKDAVDAEIDKLEAEKKEAEDKIEGLEREIEALDQELAAIEEGQKDKRKDGKVEMSEKFTRGSMEYRTAFRDYIQTGKLDKEVLEFEKRADAVSTSSDLGVLLPETIVQEIIKGIGEVHGQLYDRVRKTNLKGGVKYPIGSFTATFNRITETTKSDRQDPGGLSGYVAFGYKIGEIRLARTLLQAVLSVPVFEQEFAKVISEAYVKAMDIEIMSGTEANNECVGILTEAAAQSSRIPAANIIEFTEAEASDWTAWQKKLFAKIPLAMRAEKPEFAMTAATSRRSQTIRSVRSMLRPLIRLTAQSAQLSRAKRSCSSRTTASRISTRRQTASSSLCTGCRRRRTRSTPTSSSRLSIISTMRQTSGSRRRLSSMTAKSLTASTSIC